MDRLRTYKETIKRLEAERSNQLYKLNQKRQDRNYDPKRYEQERKVINETIDAEKKRIQEELQTYKAGYRKALATSLNAPRDNSPESEALWRQAIEKVQKAKTTEEIRELTRQATIWKDADLARALIYAHGGIRDKEYIHSSLKDLDAVVLELYNYEKEFGDYRTREQMHQETLDNMSGFVSPDQVSGADGVPGRTKSIKPPKKPPIREEQ